MGIEQTTPQSVIDAQIRRYIEQSKEKVIKLLSYIGEKCIKEARENGAYQDQTGNLRASIGYVVVDNGRIVSGSVFDMKDDGWEGKAAGEEQLRKLAAQNTSGLVLIVVAGMDYAAKVEAMNLNVLSSAELLAEREVPRLMKQLGFAA